MPGTVEYSRMRAVQKPTRDDVLAAETRVRAFLAPTPLVESDGFSLKLESLQPTGSFKVRGAVSALTLLEPGERVVTASAGNHGLAVAWAAERLGLEATIVVAETASPAKIAGIRRFPARLVMHGADYDEAELHGLSLDGRYVSPYNDAAVIAGAGTIALELPARGDDRRRRWAAAASRRASRSRRTRASSASCRRRSPRCVPRSMPGGLVEIEGGETVADGLHGNIEAGSVTFELVRDHAAAVVTVGEREIEDAMRFLAVEHGLVVEGAGAAAVAALRSGAVEADGATVAIVSGRNVTAERFAQALDHRARG